VQSVRLVGAVVIEIIDGVAGAIYFIVVDVSAVVVVVVAVSATVVIIIFSLLSTSCCRFLLVVDVLTASTIDVVLFCFLESH